MAAALYVVRHGECEHNVAKRIAAQNDSPLTVNGRAQAREGGRILREMVFSLDDLDFYSSSLHRAASTMEILREAAGLPPTGYVADRRLMEINFGDHTGLTWAQVQTAAGTDPKWTSDPWNYKHPHGESLADVHARTADFLSGIKRDSVIVTHAGPVRIIRGILLGLSQSETIQYHPPHHGVLRFADGGEAFFGE
ncbi:MAG TPA: histidine phosphatase family protein [Rhizomicrobium sp.]|jgi:probable phosphoglycerate mutase|nr:histidine phosphatase family protein [Rhizomicrobium sp.]